MVIVLCPLCEAVLKVTGDKPTFVCPCGVELHHPAYNNQAEVAAQNVAMPARQEPQETQNAPRSKQDKFKSRYSTSVPSSDSLESKSESNNEAEEKNLIRHSSTAPNIVDRMNSMNLSRSSSPTGSVIDSYNVQVTPLTRSTSTPTAPDSSSLFGKSDSKDKGLKCAQCKTKFTMLRRKKECRNCESMVCSQCSKGKWPYQMLPEKNNPRGEKWLRVCNLCQVKCESFRSALLEGKREKAEELIGQGSIQLYFPYQIYPEKQYPVHCAVLSGNLDLVEFLVSKRCNPRVVDARGQSCLALAAELGHFEISKYLIFRGFCKVKEIKSVEALHKILQTCFIEYQKLEIRDSLNRFTNNTRSVPGVLPNPEETNRKPVDNVNVAAPRNALEEEEHLQLALKMSQVGEDTDNDVDAEVTAPDSNADECAICLENPVNVVLVPCGHMVCCDLCAGKFTECPLCRSKVSNVVKTYKS